MTTDTRCYTYVESGSRGDLWQTRWKDILRKVIDSIRCDYCHAPPGDPCRTVNGFTAFWPHRPRLDAAHRISDETAATPERGWMRLYSNRGGTVGRWVPCRYRVRRSRGTTLIDYCVPESYGPNTTLTIPDDAPYPDDPHMPIILSETGEKVTVIVVDDQFCRGRGAKFTFLWDRRVPGWWTSPDW